MPQPSHLDPSAFTLPGGPTGILLLHGLTGSPPEMRLIGDYLNERGLAVSAPLLPGHGTRVEDLERYRWTDWAAAAEEALLELRSHCAAVFVAGLSLGSLLTLYLAARHPDLPGAIAYSPAVLVRSRLIYFAPVLKRAIPKLAKGSTSDLDDPQARLRLWSYDYDSAHAGHQVLLLQRTVRRLLPEVRCPLLVIYSPRDSTIRHDAAEYTYALAGSMDKQLVALQRSGHVCTVDSEWEQVAERTHRFILEHSRGDAIGVRRV